MKRIINTKMADCLFSTKSIPLPILISYKENQLEQNSIYIITKSVLFGVDFFNKPGQTLKMFSSGGHH